MNWAQRLKRVFNIDVSTCGHCGGAVRCGSWPASKNPPPSAPSSPTSQSTVRWRSKFGGMEVSMVARMKELEDENRRLKKMYAEAQLSADLLKEAMSKKW
jgi:hypothetical protein